jgi:hypothetical protein
LHAVQRAVDAVHEEELLHLRGVLATDPTNHALYKG